jgi:hypothetical protein
MSRFSTSWTIVGYSLDIMRRHPRLLAYPVVSLIAFALVSLFTFLPTEFGVTPSQVWQSLWSSEAREELSNAIRIASEPEAVPLPNRLTIDFIAYGLISTLVMTFINVAFYSQIIAAMNGEPASALKGYSQALSRLAAIVAWSIVAGAVGVLLNASQDSFWLLTVIMGLAGLCWSVVSFFVIPVMLNEPRSQTPLGYLKISIALLKRVWAEALIGVCAVFLVAILIFAATMICFTLVALRGTEAYPFFILVAIQFAVLALLYLALQIFECGLYVYATQGVAPGTFNPETFDRAWTVRDSSQGAGGVEQESAWQPPGHAKRWRAIMRAAGIGFVIFLGLAYFLRWQMQPAAPRIVADVAVTETVQGLPKLLPPDTSGSTPERDEQVTLAVLKKYPYLVQPQEDFAPAIVELVDIALRKDGSVYRSRVAAVYPGSRSAIMSDPSYALPQRLDDVSGIIFHRAGQSGKRQFRNDLWIRYVILEGEPDSSRDVERVQAAMLASHPELLLPVDGPRINKVMVFLADDGKVERHLVESRIRDSFLPVGDQVPGEYGQPWEALGLQLDRIGHVGYTWVYAPLDKNSRPEGVQGTMVVHYAWERRPDEPIGGVPMTQRHPRIVPFLHADAGEVIEHYLPGALNDKGETSEGTPWLVLSPQGDVVRSGYVRLGDEQNVDAALFEEGHPDQRIDLILENHVVRTFKKSYSRRVIFAWLTAGAEGKLQATSATN